MSEPHEAGLLRRMLRRAHGVFVRPRPAPTFADPDYRRKAIEAMHLAGGILDRHGVVFWLDFGTALGLAREQDLIRHDSDIDLGLLAETWKPECAEQLRAAGFELYPHACSAEIAARFMGGVAPPGPISYGMRRLGAAVDLCIYFAGSGVGVRGDSRFFIQWECKGVYEFPARMVEDTRMADFLGRGWRVPSDLEGYLTHAFGPDWRTPRRNCGYPCFVSVR